MTGRSVEAKSVIGFERCNSLTGSQTFGGFGVVNPLPSRHELAQVKSLQTPRTTTVHLHHDGASPGSAQELIGKVIKLLHLVNLKLSMVMDAPSHVGVSFLTRFSGEGRGVHCLSTINVEH